MTNAHVQEHHRLLLGLIAGGVHEVGALVVGPRVISALREQVADSAGRLGQKAQGVRDDLYDVVAPGAQDVECHATEANTDHAR